MSRNGSGGYSLPVNSWNPAINGVSATAADWQSLINDVATALQQSVSADGQTPITGNLAMGGNKLTGLGAGVGTGQSLRFEQLFSQGTLTSIASATTTDIGAQLSNFLQVTGTTTITSFGTNYNGPRFLIFSGALLLTHSATLVLPGAANITTVANDCAIAIPISGGWQVVAYQRASGFPVATIIDLRSTVPSSGSYVAGDIVLESTTTARISGWKRLTTGSGHVLNTDWLYFSGIGSGTTVPSSGSYTAGDIVLENSTTAGRVSGWRRLTTGSGHVLNTDWVYFNVTNINSGTAVATTSGTSIDFTGIPTGVNRITVMLNGCSLSGTSDYLVQLGDAGGIETSGYYGGLNPNAVFFSTGFRVSDAATSSQTVDCVMVLARINGTTWMCSFNTSHPSTYLCRAGAGSKTLSDTLTQLRITSVNGTDTFDAGSINILWEF